MRKLIIVAIGSTALFLVACGGQTSKNNVLSPQFAERVRVERDPAPEFPYDIRCEAPQRVHNYNAVALIAHLTMYRETGGPGCQQYQDATPMTPMPLSASGAPGAWKRLSCTRRTYEGSVCWERKSWSVDRIE